MEWEEPPGNTLLNDWMSAGTTFKRDEAERRFLGGTHLLRAKVIDVVTDREAVVQLGNSTSRSRAIFDHSVGNSLHRNQEIKFRARAEGESNFRNSQLQDKQSFVRQRIGELLQESPETDSIEMAKAEGNLLLEAKASASTPFERTEIEKRLLSERLDYAGKVDTILGESQVVVDTLTSGKISASFRTRVGFSLAKGQTIAFRGRLQKLSFLGNEAVDCELSDSVDSVSSNPLIGASPPPMTKLRGDERVLATRSTAAVGNYHVAVNERDLQSAFALRSKRLQKAYPLESFREIFASTERIRTTAFGYAGVSEGSDPPLHLVRVSLEVKSSGEWTNWSGTIGLIGEGNGEMKIDKTDLNRD